jgi:hypothetical protein
LIEKVFVARERMDLGTNPSYIEENSRLFDDIKEEF